MSATRLTTIDRVVQRGIDAGGFPGASVVVGRKGYAVWSKGFGSLDWSGRRRVTAQESVYDLASLTKVVATTTAIMVLFDQGKVELDAPVSRYIPSYTGGMKDQVTIRHLLTHRAGLPAGRELWRIAGTPVQARAAVLATPVACAPGRCFEYSDLGADILGFVVEAASGVRLDQFLDSHVFEKLGMTDTQFSPGVAVVARTAPTEIAPPRGYPLRGEVHDENAYALGGVAGHAGLFSTASDLSVFAQMLLDGGTYDGVRIVADSTVSLFTRRAAGTRGLGWDTCDGNGGCGSYLSERAYGHTGFTGTSLWIDPDRQMFVILLTNRVHAAKARRPSTIISDVRNDLADAAALAVMDAPSGVLDMPANFRADVARDWNRPLVSSRSSAVSRRKAAAAKRAAVARAAKKRSAGKASAKKTTSKVAVAKAASTRTSAAKSSSTKKPAAKSSSAKSSSSKSSSAKRSSAKSSASKKPTLKKAPVKKVPVSTMGANRRKG
ncbi:MAG TPA: serine hydrolase [Gemmatimonas sp.]|nr:serine hydrolase [Gemmatimonas sp.]